MTLMQCMQRLHSLSSIISLPSSIHMHSVGQRSMTSFWMSKGPQSRPHVVAGVGGDFAADIGLNGFLVDPDVIFPGTDKGHVGPGDGGHAAVGAAVELEFELVGEGRTMEFVLVFLGQVIAQGLGVVAGILTAGLADTVGGGSQVGAGTAQVLVQVVGQFIKDLFQLGGGGPQEDDVAGRTVHVGDAAAAKIPQVADASQIIGLVELAARLVHAHGVEMGHARETFRAGRSTGR